MIFPRKTEKIDITRPVLSNFFSAHFLWNISGIDDSDGENDKVYYIE